MMKKLKLPAAQELGRRGGMKTLKKYGKRQMKEWGKQGGRPKKKLSTGKHLQNLAVGL